MADQPEDPPQDQQHQDSAQVTAIKNSCRGHRSWFTRTVTAAHRAATFHAKTPTGSSLDQLKRNLQGLERYRSDVNNAYRSILTVDDHPDQQTYVLDRFQAVEQDFINASEALTKAMAAVEAHFNPPANPRGPAPAPAPAGPAQPGVKVQDALKPKVLQRDSTPVEFTEFKRSYRSYHETSRLGTLPPAQQQAFLFACLSSSVATELRLRIDDTTPVFANRAEPSCMASLTTLFEIWHPVYTRRLHFFRLMQAKGQDFTAYLADLRRAGEEADLPGLTVDHLYVYKIFASITDDNLREKLLKLGEPNLQQVITEATAQEVAKRANKATKKEDNPTSARTVRQGPSSSGPQAGHCTNCGKTPKCNPNSCRAKNSTCNKCNKKGHWAKCHGINLCPLLQSHSGNNSNQRSSNRRGCRPSARARAATDHEESSPGTVVTSRAECRAVNCGNSNAPTPLLRVHVEDARKRKILDLEAVPDTGATRTLISEQLLRGTSAVIKREKVQLFNASDRRMTVTGSTRIHLYSPVHDRRVEVHALVIPHLRDKVLISWHDLVDLGALPPSFPRANAAEVRKVESQSADSLEAIKEDFADVLGDSLDDSSGAIKGPPMKIELNPKADVKPLRVTTARPTPVHLVKPAEELMAELLAAGTVVPQKEPTEWVAPAHFVEKPGNRARLISDFRRLNMAILRPIHPICSATDLIQKVDPKAKVFASLDATHGYFQVPLDDASSRLTTFLLPTGRFRYRAAPMGLCSSSDEFCNRSDAAVAGLPGVLKIVDDLLIQGEDLPQLYSRLRAVLQRCREAGLKMSLKKMKIGSQVKFAGYMVGKNGVSPDPDKLEAIRDFKAPSNVSEMRSFLGLANQLGHFHPDMAVITAPLRQLLKKNVAYLWLPEHEAAFQEAKEILCSDALVKPFDPALETELLCDASRLHGIGCALIQRDAEGKPRLIHCASQSLTSAQSRYSTVELEALAVAVAVQKCRFYLRGCPHFKIITDHRSLVGVFTKPLVELENARLARLREKLAGYTFTIEWTPGKDNLIADALSRAPVFPAPEEEEEEGEDNAVCRRVLADDPAFDGILAAAAEDRHYQRLIAAVMSGDSSRDEFSPYRPVWSSLSIEGQDETRLVVLDGSRVVVPRAARQEVLRLLHLPHCGLPKTYMQGRQLFYWPIMKNDIKQALQRCEVCLENQPSLPKLPLQQTSADLPMQSVSADFFELAGQNYLVACDRFSGFPFVRKMNSTTTEATTKAFEAWFQDFGYPTRIVSDNGPQFRAQFKEWCQSRGIRHETSSPHNPASNGHAEAAVKNVKGLLEKCQKEKSNFAQALLEWRNTPRSNGISPAQAFFGRRLRTLLPCLDVTPFTRSFKEMAAVRQETSEASKKYFDASAHDLPPLSVDDIVRVQNPASKDWDQVGKVLRRLEHGRSYQIDIDGRTYRKNHRFLRLSKNIQERVDDAIADTRAPAPVQPRRSTRIAAKKN